MATESAMAPARRTPGAAPVLILTALAAGGMLTFAGLATRLPLERWVGAALAPRMDAAELVFHFGLLPRIAMSLLAGAALGLSGALFGHVLRNPLAEPSTLGTASGAGLALAVATVHAPALLDIGRFWVTLAGALAATAVALAIAWRRRFSPVTLILAGLVVGMSCSAIGGVMVLLRHHHLTALFLWQSGSLAQTGWHHTLLLAAAVVAAAAVCAMIVRPLAVIELDDAAARALGVPMVAIRLLGLGVATALAAAVVSSVGVIAFVGLAAPALARLAGARRMAARLIGSAAAGALLLWVADQTAQAAGRLADADLPTGLLTALVGAPLLLVLLPRLRESGVPPMGEAVPHRISAATPAALLLFALAVLALGLLVGRGDAGWLLAFPGESILQWRWPRVLCAFGAGALLALAGMMIQRVTANPMASPELLGISSGAAAGAMLFVILAPTVDRSGLLGSAFAGATAVLLALLILGRRSGYAPERLLLTGVAITTVVGAFLGAVLLSGHPRLDLMLRMMAGSTYFVSGAEAGFVLSLAAGSVLLLPFVASSLTLLPLGAPVASSLGLAVDRSRLVLLGLVAGLTAAATLIVGPLSFVGLIAPHAARMTGFRRPASQGIAAMLIGGTAMVLADWLGRMVAFPWQLPAGLLASLAGGPYFLWLMLRKPA